MHLSFNKTWEETKKSMKWRINHDKVSCVSALNISLTVVANARQTGT